MTIRTKPDTGTAHTEGPWKAMKGRYGWQIHTDKANSKPAPHLNHWIASMKCESTPFAEEANARLIAAAPEMLAGLTEIVDRFECALEAVHATKTDRALIRRARKTIAKATGAQP